MRPGGIVIVFIFIVLLTSPVVAENWPHWRGPDRNGVSREADVPVHWSSEQNVTWKLPLPYLSGSTPIIWEDRIFLHVAEPTSLALWSVDRRAGTIQWIRQLDDRNENKRKGNMSSPSPVTDGEMVFVMTGTGVLSAFDFSGRELWRRDLQAEFGRFGILHGYSSSPLLFRDTIYIQVLHGFHTDDPSYLLAVNKRSGETRWRTERPTDAPREAPDAYTTPALLQSAGRAIIVISGADYVTGHDPETGREVWRVPGLNPSANPMQRIVASPVVAGDMIFAPSRVNPLLALQVAGGVERQPRTVWSMDRGPDVPTPVVDGDRIYLLTDKGIVWCLEAKDGRVIWGPKRIRSAIYSSSPVIAGGRLYATSEEGLTTVVAIGQDFQVLAENHLGEYTLSSLAISEGQIFLRTAEHLYCIGEPRKSAS